MQVSNQLKQAIRNSGLSMSDIARETGIAVSVIGRFISDDPDYHRDIRLERTADRLAEFFGLELAEKKKKR